MEYLLIGLVIGLVIGALTRHGGSVHLGKLMLEVGWYWGNNLTLFDFKLLENDHDNWFTIIKIQVFKWVFDLSIVSR